MSTAKKIGLLAAIVTLVGIPVTIRSCFHDSAPTATVTTQDLYESPVIVMEEAGDITINYNVPGTETKNAIAALEQKLSDASDTSELNREEIRLLTLALKDLDQRTSGIEKLPDGRTKIGQIVSGRPTIVLEEHNAANMNYKDANFLVALEHSKKAIYAFEASEVFKGMQAGRISNQDVGKIYFLGSLIAQRLNEKELANRWAEKSIEKHSTPKSQALLATALFNLGQRDEALNVLDKSLEIFPDDEILLNYKTRMLTISDSSEKQ